MMDMMDGDHDHYDPFVGYPNDNDLNNRLLVISMASFTLVLFFLFCLYLYTRCFFTRRSRYLARDRDGHNTHFYTEPPTIRLDPAIVTSLSTFTVRTKVLDGESNSDASVVECVVCLSSLEGEEKAKLLPNCNHFFHVGCIDTWLSSQSTCPSSLSSREDPICFVSVDLRTRYSTSVLFNSINGGDETPKSNGSSSGLSSFRRILSGERSSRRIQPSSHDDEDGDGVNHDLERQEIRILPLYDKSF